MNADRIITFINPAAINLTGWKIKDFVPYCQFCQNRIIAPGEERCYLTTTNEEDYMDSKMPTKWGDWIDVGISRTLLPADPLTGQRRMVITVRDVSRQKKQEEYLLSQRLAHHTIEVQEEERKRLSQELHDGLSQTLFGLSLGMEYIQKKTIDPDLKKRLAHLLEETKSTIHEVRTMSHQLFPSVLSEVGLVGSLRTLSNSLSDLNVNVSFKSNIFNYDISQINLASIHLYRITQEAIHNAIQHGKATQILVELNKFNQSFELRITDNGKGFSVEKHPKNGYGLNNMQMRTQTLNGTLTIHSKIGLGTTITVSVPSNHLNNKK